MYLSGYELANDMLHNKKINEVIVLRIPKEKEHTFFQNELIVANYNPRLKIIALKESTSAGKGLLDIIIAAHEVAHAIQHIQENKLINLITNVQSLYKKLLGCFYILFFYQGIMFFGYIIDLQFNHFVHEFTKATDIMLLMVVFLILVRNTLILFIEIDASKKAFHYLKSKNIIDLEHEKVVKKVYRLNNIHYLKESFIFYL